MVDFILKWQIFWLKVAFFGKSCFWDTSFYTTFNPLKFSSYYNTSGNYQTMFSTGMKVPNI